jgi:tetratricopeptide (TPR) repeat protein
VSNLLNTYMKPDRLCTALILLMFATCLFSQSFNAQQELSQGVQALKQNKIADAVRHLKTAVSLDDKLVNAHLYLATALASEYIPGADAPENVERGEQAIEEYKKVSDLSPENPNSFKGVAALLFNMKRLEEAKEYYRKVIELDQGDSESYYAIAMVDWSQAYTARLS